mmetsp:Transcript_3276/g.6502  ORF Transcript_3276/g.6502 Transcript_3276/m.6502 type:complete len:153 (+) Transcript_3276:50-508(+)
MIMKVIIFVFSMHTSAAFNIGRIFSNIKVLPVPRITLQELLAPAIFLSVSLPSSAFADSAILFETNCASCHPGGSNVVGYARAKTLKTEALVNNGYNTQAAVVNIIENGQGIMPRFSSGPRFDGAIVPERLSHDEIESVASYVLEQASQNWK